MKRDKRNILQDNIEDRIHGKDALIAALLDARQLASVSAGNEVETHKAPCFGSCISSGAEIGER